MSEAVVLNFHDSLLRESDLKLLHEPCWLNDKLIGFVCEYFEHILFMEHSGKVTYISPDVAQFIKFGEGAELGIFLEPLNLESKDVVFLAVNDNASGETAGGSHWSLLVYHRASGEFSHYDSGGGNNHHAAVNIAKQVEPFLQATSSVKFVESSCPQQHNGYDCGLYVICIAEHLSRHFLEGCTLGLADAITPSVVTQKRSALRDLISQLAEQGYR